MVSWFHGVTLCALPAFNFPLCICFIPHPPHPLKQSAKKTHFLDLPSHSLLLPFWVKHLQLSGHIFFFFNLLICLFYLAVLGLSYGTRASLFHHMWDLSSLTRDQTCISCIGRWIINHWTTRKVPGHFFFFFFWAALGLHCLWLSLVAECRGAALHCSVQAYRSGLSSYRAWALECWLRSCGPWT